MLNSLTYHVTKVFTISNFVYIFSKYLIKPQSYVINSK